MPMGAGEEAPRQDEGTCRWIPVEMASNRSFLRKKKTQHPRPKKNIKKLKKKSDGELDWKKCIYLFLKNQILNIEMDSGDIPFPSSFLRGESIRQIFRMGHQCWPVPGQKIHVYGITCR